MISANPVLKTCLIPIIPLLFLTGCKPPDTRERFTHAMLHPNEQIGLFVFKRESSYPGDMLTGTPERYVVNVTIIGSYELA